MIEKSTRKNVIYRSQMHEMRLAQAKAQVRLKNWQMMYNEYANSGMTVKEWCESNNLSVKTFYYRLKRLRMETLNREHHDIVAVSKYPPNNSPA